MFCPQCGSTQSDELKFCKSCGVNLDAVREVAAMRPAGEKFDWSSRGSNSILRGCCSNY